MASVGRAKANQLAGVAVNPTGHKSVESVPDAIQKSAGAVTLPVFNMVDDSDSTQESVTKVVGSVFGIKTGSHGNIMSSIQGLKMKSLVEVRLRTSRHTLLSILFDSQEVNEVHMEQWAKIIQGSKPPVVNTPLSPYLQPHVLEEHGNAVHGAKLKRVCSGLRLRS